MQRLKKFALLLFVTSLSTSLQGQHSSLNSLIGKNYRWDEYFENTKVTITEATKQSSPCDPIVGNSGSLFTTNQIAEFKVPSYRVIEKIEMDSKNERIVDYLMYKLESNVRVSDLPEEHQSKVSETVHELISEGCFQAILLTSNEPIESYLTIRHSRRTSEGLSYATTDGFIFHQKFFMHVTRDVLNPKANEFPKLELEEPEVEVPIRPLPDKLAKPKAYQGASANGDKLRR